MSQRDPPLPAVNSQMRVIDIVTLVPQAADVMATWGLHCSGCAVGGLESLEEGCRAHGYSDEDIRLLLADIEEAWQTTPARPAVIHVTAAAARAIRAVAEEEGESAWRERGGLAVIVDGAGGFCMEFRTEPEVGDRTFVHAEESDVRVFASLLTLGRIGGATIDFRDGRFKLDLPEDGCGCTPMSCSCIASDGRRQNADGR